MKNDRVPRRNDDRFLPLLFCNFDANYTARGGAAVNEGIGNSREEGFDRWEKRGIIGASEKKGAIFHEL